MSQSSMSQLPCKSYWSNKLLELKPHSTSQGWRWLSPTGSTEIGFQKDNAMQLMLMWLGERKWKLHGPWKVVSQCEKNLKGIGSRVSDKETKNQPSSCVDNIFPRVPGLLIVSNICKYQYVTTIYSWCGLLQEVDEKSKGYEENGVGWWERRQSSYFSPVLPLPPIILDVMMIVMTMTMIMMMISDIWWWIIINDNDKDDGKENAEPPSEPAWPCPHCRWWPRALPPPWQDFWQHLPPDHHHHCYHLQNLNL